MEYPLHHGIQGVHGQWVTLRIVGHHVAAGILGGVPLLAIALLTADVNLAGRSNKIAGVDFGEMMGLLYVGEYWDFVRRSQDSLRTLAEATGGIAVVNKNDFDSALKRIDAETSDYYVLGYYSTNTDPSAWRRSLTIDVMRDDLDVWSRTAYELRDTDDTIETSQQ